jgi:hypothetical protein
MKLSRPSLGTLLGGLALFVALGGTAVAATGTIVNIADPGNASRVAKVDAAGRLQVGGLVNERPLPPTDLWRVAAAVGGFTCQVVATPPPGKAIVVRDLSISVYDGVPADFDGSHFIGVYNNATCTGAPVWDMVPMDNGTTTVQFDPGVSVPTSQSLSAIDFSAGTYGFEIYAHGYLVASAYVPNTAVSSGKTAADPRAPAGR